MGPKSFRKASENTLIKTPILTVKLHFFTEQKTVDVLSFKSFTILKLLTPVERGQFCGSPHATNVVECRGAATIKTVPW